MIYHRPARRTPEAVIAETAALTQVQATRAKAQLGNATFVTLPACGHVPMNDNPALVAQVILQAGSNS